MRLKSYAVDQIMPFELANCTISLACFVTNADCLELRTHWLNEQPAYITISQVTRCVVATCKPDPDKVELNPVLKQYLDVWNTLVVESGFLRHMN